MCIDDHELDMHLPSKSGNLNSSISQVIKPVKTAWLQKSKCTCLDKLEILSADENFVRIYEAIFYIFLEICPQNFFPDPEREVPVYGSKLTLRKSVPALFVRTCEISGLSESGLTNHHCIFFKINFGTLVHLFNWEVWEFNCSS